MLYQVVQKDPKAPQGVRVRYVDGGKTIRRPGDREEDLLSIAPVEEPTPYELGIAKQLQDEGHDHDCARRGAFFDSSCQCAKQEE